MAHLTRWIGLDDARVDDGCIHYVPGSHTWPLLPITGLADDMPPVPEGESMGGRFFPLLFSGA